MFAEYLDHHDLTELLVLREGYMPFPRRQAQIGNRKERFSATMRVSRVGSPTYPVVYPFMPVVAMPSMK